MISLNNLLVGSVARVPVRVQTKLLIAFLAIVALLIALGAVGLYTLSGVNQRTEELIRNERKIAGAILTCWSLVHGLTQLIADGLVGPGKKSGEICETLVKGMLDGLTVRCPTLPLGAWVGPQT